MTDDMQDALARLYDVIAQLRAPGGCPWDREQTAATLWPYLLEETYEVKDALESPPELKEELGDVLLQVIMQSVIANEAGHFDFGDVCRTITEKMIHRHPHVFGDVEVENAQDVVTNWERLKDSEKQERTSIIDGVPRALPGLVYASALQERPSRLQWDPLRDTDLLAHAAMTAMATVVSQFGPGEGNAGRTSSSTAPETRETEVGELLYLVVAMARHLGVDPEEAVRTVARREGDRYRALEQRARSAGHDVHTMTQERWNDMETSESPG